MIDTIDLPFGTSKNQSQSQHGESLHTVEANADAQARRTSAAASPVSDTCTPADRYQELFVAVQRGCVFDDSKTFVDCAPLAPPEDILVMYRRECNAVGFDLRQFVGQHFEVQHHVAETWRAAPGETMEDYIESMWKELTRDPARQPRYGSLLQLPHAYVVPGGRFVELYYWDSYFTMLGLGAPQHQELLHAMTDNFAYLIDTYGHVPNGTRTYYLSRSQPPVFALMAELCETCHGKGAARYLPQLVREHAFWMDGAQTLGAGDAHRRVVALPDGSLLNRYWDDRDTAREESWREDVATAERSKRPAAEVFRDLRAAAESGWDFSSRWFEDDDGDLATTCTTRILPVDLNALLHKLESTIAKLSAETGDEASARQFMALAARRQAAMNKYLWNVEAAVFLDYDWQKAQPRPRINAAAVTPLFTRTATVEQAKAMVPTLRRELLAPGGFATTQIASGEQWDRPNGWAPLQHMAVEGLIAYGYIELADDIRTRWLKSVDEVYRREGKLVEKYALRATENAPATGGGGGEYPLQDGFGWTNGVLSQWRGRSVVLGATAFNEVT